MWGGFLLDVSHHKLSTEVCAECALSYDEWESVFLVETGAVQDRLGRFLGGAPESKGDDFPMSACHRKGHALRQTGCQNRQAPVRLHPFRSAVAARCFPNRYRNCPKRQRHHIPVHNSQSICK